jgi:hypothetical protein
MLHHLQPCRQSARRGAAACRDAEHMLWCRNACSLVDVLRAVAFCPSAVTVRPADQRCAVHAATRGACACKPLVATRLAGAPSVYPNGSCGTAAWPRCVQTQTKTPWPHGQMRMPCWGCSTAPPAHSVGTVPYSHVQQPSSSDGADLVSAKCTAHSAQTAGARCCHGALGPNAARTLRDGVPRAQCIVLAARRLGHSRVAASPAHPDLPRRPPSNLGTGVRFEFEFCLVS